MDAWSTGQREKEQPPVNPIEFQRKWIGVELKERSASQEHFLDICRRTGHQTPAEMDPTGDTFTFERGASKSIGGQGWADVWYRGHFAWEYKGPHKDLVKACDQLLRYKNDLENPPLLIVSDHGESEIRDHLGSADAPAGRHLRPKRGRSRVRPSGDVADVSTVQQPECSSSMMADDGRCHDSARSVSTKTVNRNSLRKTRFCMTRSIL